MSKSIESRCTIGAMASKNASAASPVSARIVSASAGEVRGPVATITLSHSSRKLEDFLAADLDQRLVLKRRSDRGGKAIAVDRKRSAGRQHVGVGRAHHQRAEPAHFLVQEADGAALRVVGAERVRANELGEISRLVHCGRAQRPHFVQHHGHAAARELPGRLRTGEAAADNVNRSGKSASRPKVRRGLLAAQCGRMSAGSNQPAGSWRQIGPLL